MKVPCNTILVLIILMPLVVTGQTTESKYQPLAVGDKIPDYTLVNLINYPTSTAQLSDFHGKLLILDFWNTSCSSCIESWPKLLELQREFQDEIQIILVNTKQDEVVVRKAFERRKKIARVNVTLPTVCKDERISELVPHSSVPWIVWIGDKGVVKSITGGRSVNKKNIKAILNNEEVNMPQIIGNDELVLVENHKPLFIDGNGEKAREIFWYSIFDRGDRKLFPKQRIAADYEIENGKYYAICINRSIREMYRLAYSDGSAGSFHGLQLNRVSLEMDDLSKYVASDEYGEIHPDYLFSYQLISKIPITREKIKELMQTDLKRYVGLNARMEKRKMECFVLTASDTSLIAYKHGEFRLGVNDSIVNVNNVFVPDLIGSVLEQLYKSYPVIDETGYKGKLGNIKFMANALDHKELDKGLGEYGMHFKLEEREVDILILSEPEGYQFPYDKIKSSGLDDKNQ